MTNYLIYDPENADTEQSSDHLLRSALSFLLDGRNIFFNQNGNNCASALWGRIIHVLQRLESLERLKKCFHKV